MKGSLVAAAAVLVGSASAHLNHRHAAAHHLFEKRDNEVCTTFITTIYGPITWVPTPAPKPTTSSVFVNTTTAFANTTVCLTSTTSTTSTTPVPVTPTVAPTTSTTTKTSSTTSTVTETPCTVPTIAVQTCPTPGVYTFPATTVVVTETTTVCGGSTTSVPAGTHTLGGVVTVVETATEVVCPYATTSTLPGGVVTSIIETTTYVCPSAGTYTIAPITTVCETDVVVVVPVVTTFTPATYTRPAVITTVIETDIVVYCPFEIPTVTVVPATTAAPAPKPVTTTKAAAPPPPATTTTAAAAKPSATKAVTSGGKLGTSGNKWAITYTPYSDSGGCKSASAVLSDLTEIHSKGFTTVRVYSTDCDTLPNVGAACASLGLKMIIGVFIGEVGCDNGNPDVQAQIAAIKAWGQWDLVELAVVGNEAGNNGYCTPAQLSSLIVEVKQLITEAGCDVPVTTTDTVNTWQDEAFSSAICAVVDVVACNAHGYFNAETAPHDAGKFVQSQLDIVKSICGLEGYVMETGWPSVCVPNGLATCSTENQAQAIQAIQTVVGGEVVFFSYSDDTWKDDGSCGCEQHWGCGQLF